jgi:hypothetical protein
LEASYQDDDQEGHRGHVQESHRQDDHQEGHQENVQESVPVAKHGPDDSSPIQSTQTLDSDTNVQPAQVSLDSISTPNDVKPSQAPAQKHGRDKPDVPQSIFAKNIRPPAMEINLPKADERLSTTPQLAACLSLLKHSQLLDDMLEPSASKMGSGNRKRHR